MKKKKYRYTLEVTAFKQEPGAEKFFEAPAPAPLQFQICSGNFTLLFVILIHNVYYKKEC